MAGMCVKNNVMSLRALHASSRMYSQQNRNRRMPSVTPKNAPVGFVPFYASTLEYAEKLRTRIETHAKSSFEMKLDWDEVDTDKWITVTFEYAPNYLFDMVITHDT